MCQRISQTPETVAELVDLQNYVIESRDVTMYNLKETIRKQSEVVLFLMKHAILSGTNSIMQNNP